MKITKTMIAAVACLCVAQHAEAWNTFQTGNTYRHLSNLARAYYIEGQIDGFFMEALSDNRPLAESIDTCIAGISTDQVQVLVNKQLDQNPEQWDMNVSAFVFGALAELCAKRGKPLKGLARN